ncbi:FecR family protein [Geminisphaera colitermitum]|uniref:FecR family protein n=1 Tax=Geminisphaera colitermitum TaxID=1148786 RepID=UPI000158D483|nr:FecR domain-containing protein [Geminisphaera colitermitum]
MSYLPTNEEKRAFLSLTTRYLLDEASAAERERLVELLKQPVWRAMFDEMSDGWNCSSANWLEGSDVEGEVEKLKRVIAAEFDPDAAMGAGEDAPETRNEPPGRWSHSRRWFALAFAASMAAVAILIVYPLFHRSGHPSDSQPNRTWVRQSNGDGERKEIALEDGTRITLNAASDLSYPSAFDTNTRVVRLTGEAFFDVAHDTGRPFIVETSTLRIKVLGTQFNVKAFEDGTVAQVTLVTGKVEVVPLGPGTAHAPVTLSPGMQYSMAADTGESKLLAGAAQAAVGWMSNHIVWEEERLPEAMKTLERRYGVTIELRDEALRDETVTGRFQSESLPEILGMLRATGGIDFSIKEDGGKIKTVVLRKPDNPPARVNP